MLLGGGRQAADDQLDYAVGIHLHKKIGDQVTKGEPLLTIFSNQTDITEVKQLLSNSIEIADATKKPTLVYETIGAADLTATD